MDPNTFAMLGSVAVFVLLICLCGVLIISGFNAVQNLRVNRKRADYIEKHDRELPGFSPVNITVNTEAKQQPEVEPRKYGRGRKRLVAAH